MDTTSGDHVIPDDQPASALAEFLETVAERLQNLSTADQDVVALVSQYLLLEHPDANCVDRCAEELAALALRRAQPAEEANNE